MIDLNRDHVTTVNLALAFLNQREVDILLETGAFTGESGVKSSRVTGARNIAIRMVKDTVIQSPVKTSVLMQNYPNPFNPDTWMPYQLAEDTFVIIAIHDSAGKLIKTLDLGYKEAGFYASKGKAAYWDGKNQKGELVASGIYFYTIQAGDFTATRKMIVAE